MGVYNDDEIKGKAKQGAGRVNEKVGKWTDPAPVAKEDWKFPACPVNGPSISARGRNVAVAWFQLRP